MYSINRSNWMCSHSFSNSISVYSIRIWSWRNKNAVTSYGLLNVLHRNIAPRSTITFRFSKMVRTSSIDIYYNQNQLENPWNFNKRTNKLQIGKEMKSKIGYVKSEHSVCNASKLDIVRIHLDAQSIKYYQQISPTNHTPPLPHRRIVRNL